MTLILHLVFAQDPIRVILDHYLIAFVESIGGLIEIASTNQEESPCWSLYTLEVVWEIH